MNRDGDILVVATGGGGDALAALMLAEALGSEAAGVVTFAWERKMFDPRPGPRGPADFAGLDRRGAHNWRISRHSRLRAGKSFLPQLAARTAVPLYLLDPASGAEGLGRQLAELAQLQGITKTVLVDVGGDILARGCEPGLRSPLADALALAASADLPQPVVLCLGLGLDGELGNAERRGLLHDAMTAGWGTSSPLPSALARRYRDFFAWHPSEATGMACLAALGYRGKVEMRADGLTVSLDAESAEIHQFEYREVQRRNLVAAAVAGTRSLAAAEERARAVCGRTELEIERRAARARAKREGRRLDADLMPELEADLKSYCDRAEARGVRYLTMRRVAEVLALDGTDFAAFRSFLDERAGNTSRLPLWPCAKSERSEWSL